MTTPAIRTASAPHALDADYVRDQLVARTVDVNGKTYNPDGEYVLYWMQSTHRLEENWGLRAAIRAASVTDENKLRLRGNTDELVARGGYGSPTIFVDRTDMYFGNDRLPLVRDGKLIGEFQGLQHRAAHLYSELEIARAAVIKAQQLLDAGSEKAELMVSVAKAKAGTTTNLAVREGVQMHGGIGMTDEYDIGLYMKRDRALAEFMGDAYYHAERVAQLSGY